MCPIIKKRKNNMKNEKMKIIIDTDPGVDDALAILMILAAPNIEVLAITTVAGNSTIENVSKNAKYLLEIAGRADIPIFVGESCPLEKKLITANVHGETGLGDIDLTKTREVTSEICAAEKIAELVENNPNEITILALGPLTNIAKVLLANKKLEKKIKQLVIMGGAINVAGNKSRVAEFNFFVDPEAAKIVFESSVPKVLVPLDLCNQVIMQESEIGQLGDGKISNILQKMLRPYIRNIAKFDGIKGAVMYDPLAAYYLIDQLSFRMKKTNIVIETKGEYTAGMSVADKRSMPENLANTEVTVAVNQQKFFDDLFLAIRTLDSGDKSE